VHRAGPGNRPEVLLMDEPASALDPASTSRIEDLIFELRDRYTIVIVTHNMQQARPVFPIGRRSSIRANLSRRVPRMSYSRTQLVSRLKITLRGGLVKSGAE